MIFVSSRFLRWLPVLVCAAGAAQTSTADSANQASAAALHKAVRLNDAATVESIGRRQKALLNAAGENGITPLAEAIRWGHVGIYTLLIEHGVDIDRADADGRTALHFAAMGDERDALRMLIAGAADINARDDYRYTPLHMAAREGHGESLRLLVTAGAELNARIDVGFTAIDLAQAYPSLQDYLRQHGGKAAVELD